MIDLVFLYLRAGDGGNGRVSFRREKYVPKGGPDGGFGGNGGSIVLRATTGESTLHHLAGVKKIIAEPGEFGGKRQMTGAKADDLVIEVPVGTVVWDVSTPELIERRREIKQAIKMLKIHRRYEIEKEGQSIPTRPGFDTEYELHEAQNQFAKWRRMDFKELPKDKVVALTEPGQEFVICKGGDGGKGSMAFKSPWNTTPLEAEYGTPGEERVVALELQLLADVGLVGLPNAGKSTLLGRLTKARPRVADYPFTTLEPHLGIMPTPQSELVIADIPGLIEGASQGKGLGYQFLRHVNACKVLWFVLNFDEQRLLEIGDLFEEDGSGKTDSSKTQEELVQFLWDQYQTLLGELRSYDKNLPEKPKVISLNKCELYPEWLLKLLVAKFKEHDVDLKLLSAATGMGIEEISTELGALYLES